MVVAELDVLFPGQSLGDVIVPVFGLGQIAFRVTERSGELVGAVSVGEADELVCIGSQGNTVKLNVKGIPSMGKTAQGVRIVNVEKPDFVVGVARVIKED